MPTSGFMRLVSLRPPSAYVVSSSDELIAIEKDGGPAKLTSTSLPMEAIKGERDWASPGLKRKVVEKSVEPLVADLPRREVPVEQ